MTSGHEMERVYSFNPGAHTGPTGMLHLIQTLIPPAILHETWYCQQWKSRLTNEKDQQSYKLVNSKRKLWLYNNDAGVFCRVIYTIPMSVTGIPNCSDAMAVHLPVPFYNYTIIVTVTATTTTTIIIIMPPPHRAEALGDAFV